MTISVIIPFYRDILALRRAVFTAPLSSDVEVIVVENGDEQIPSGFLPDAVRIDRSPKGAGIARNRGIDLARGNWILFLDADDWFEPWAIRRLLEMAHSDADVIYFMSRAVNLQSLSPSMRNEQFNTYLTHFLDSGDERLLRYKCGIPVCKMLRTSLLRDNNIRFDEIPCCEDKSFGLKVGFHASRIEVLPERLYVISESDSSLSRQFSLSNLRVTMQAYIDYNRFLKRHRLPVRRDSVISLVWRAHRQYGLKPALSLSWMSVRQGNSLLTGCTKWLSTLSNITRFCPRVIVNADDMGLTPEINLAIVDSFIRMTIGSTSLMVNAPASDHALDLIRKHKLERRTGLHFNLCEGIALSDSLRHCPRFALPDGTLCYTHRMWLRLSSVERKALRDECEAQIQWMTLRGVIPQHFDSHFHVHTSPSIYFAIRPVLKSYGIKRVRIGRNLQIHGALNRIYKCLFRLILRLDGFDVTRYFSDTDHLDEHLTDIEYECHPKSCML